jgi:hypothetical protein
VSHNRLSLDTHWNDVNADSNPYKYYFCSWFRLGKEALSDSPSPGRAPYTASACFDQQRKFLVLPVRFCKYSH